MSKPKEAPWNTISLRVKLDDGKIYKLYYLGERGKDILKNAVCRTQCWQARDQFEKEIRELKSMLNVLTDLIGGPDAMVEYFKRHILVQLQDKSCRTGDLTVKPYSEFRYVALGQLLKEEKIVHTRNGWWKLGTI